MLRGHIWLELVRRHCFTWDFGQLFLGRRFLGLLSDLFEVSFVTKYCLQLIIFAVYDGLENSFLWAWLHSAYIVAAEVIWIVLL